MCEYLVALSLSFYPSLYLFAYLSLLLNNNPRDSLFTHNSTPHSNSQQLPHPSSFLFSFLYPFLFPFLSSTLILVSLWLLGAMAVAAMLLEWRIGEQPIFFRLAFLSSHSSFYS